MADRNNAAGGHDVVASPIGTTTKFVSASSYKQKNFQFAKKEVLLLRKVHNQRGNDRSIQRLQIEPVGYGIIFTWLSIFFFKLAASRSIFLAPSLVVSRTNFTSGPLRSWVGEGDGWDATRQGKAGNQGRSIKKNSTAGRCACVLPPH